MIPLKEGIFCELSCMQNLKIKTTPNYKDKTHGNLPKTTFHLQ